MHNKTRNAIRFQKLIAFLLVLFSIFCIFVPFTRTKITIEEETAEKYQEYLDNAAALSLLSSPSVEELQEVMQNVAECSDFLERSLQKDKNGELVGFEMEFSLFSLIRYAPKAVRMEKNATQQNLQGYRFTDINVNALKILCWYAPTANRTEGAIDSFMPILFLIMYLLFLITFIITTITSITAFFKPFDVNSYHNTVGGHLSLILLFGLSIFPYLLAGSIFKLTPQATPYAYVALFVYCAATFLCSLSSFFKNNSDAQIKYLTAYWLFKFLEGACNIIIFFNLQAYLFAFNVFTTLFPTCGLIFIPLNCVQMFASGIGISNDNPYQKKSIQRPGKIFRLPKQKADPPIFAVFATFLIISPLLLLINKKDKVYPMNEIIPALIGTLLFCLIRIIIRKAGKKRLQKIDISPEEKRRLLYGVPDDTPPPQESDTDFNAYMPPSF